VAAADGDGSGDYIERGYCEGFVYILHCSNVFR